MVACYARRPAPLRTYTALELYGRYITRSSAYSIEVAIEDAILDVETSGAIEEVLIEETIVESNAIVEAIEEAIEEHQADIEAIEEALL